MNRSLSSMTLLTFHGISAPSSKRSPLIHSVRNPPGLFCQPSPRSVPSRYPLYPHQRCMNIKIKRLTKFAICRTLILKDIDDGGSARESRGIRPSPQNQNSGSTLRHVFFFPKSAESIENKRVDFFVSAKKCKPSAKECARV